MHIHASCAARGEVGVLLIGAPGSGKSDLVLRLLDHGYSLVADDRVDLEDGVASAPALLAGLLEVRGLGIVRLPYLRQARLGLVVELGVADRLPEQRTRFGLPLVHVDASQASAPARVTLALRCACGEVSSVAGAFA